LPRNLFAPRTLFPAIVVALLSSKSSFATDGALLAQFRANDVRLLSAVHTADKTVYETLATTDFHYIDEEGTVFTKAVFTAQLEPMSTPPLKIQQYSGIRVGDTMLILHLDTDEEGDEYQFSETWQRVAGAWRVRSIQLWNVLVDPVPAHLTRAQLDQLTGTYSNGNSTVLLSRNGDTLTSSHNGAAPTEQRAETPDVLFVPGMPRVRKLFVRDPAGRVTGFLTSYSGHDTLWTRTGDAAPAQP